MLGLIKKRYIVSVGIGIVIFVTGFWSAWYIKGLHVKELSLRLKTEEIKLMECISANQNIQKTVSELNRELLKAKRLCARRLSIKERTLKRLQEIEESGIKQQPIVNEVRDEDIVSNDPILLELNRMFR